MYRYRWRVNGAIRWDRLPLNSFKLPHAYFYGNCRAKIPNISQRCGNSPAKYKSGESEVSTWEKDRIFLRRSRRGYLRGLLPARCRPTDGPALFSERAAPIKL
jgi:hypothetical protein